MEEQNRSWSSEEAMANLESLTRLDWDRERLPEGARELLGTYETAIPQLTTEIRRLREELRKQQQDPAEESSEGSEGKGGYEDLTEFARRLGLDQR